MSFEGQGYLVTEQDMNKNSDGAKPDDDIRPNDSIVELSANIDDMSAEEIGFAFERLLEAGAADVYAIPAIMKKNRPATILNVLCKEEKKAEIIKAIFLYTKTIGIREKAMERYILNREFYTINTPDGEVRVKKVSGYGVGREKLEYDDLCKIAKNRGISIEQAKKYAEKYEK